MPEALREMITHPTVQRLLVLAGGLIAVLLVVRLVQRATNRSIANADARYRVRKFVGFAGYLAAILVVVFVFGDRLGGLTVALGLAGAGVAFALQEIIVSVAGWLALSLGGYYKVGDRIRIAGLVGDVIDIGVVRTTLMECGDWVDGDLYNGRVVRVSNGFVFKEPVYNYSGEFSFLWDEITVPVRHGSDRARARALLEEVAREVTGRHAESVQEAWERLVRGFRLENARLEPMVSMVADGGAITYTVRYVVDFRRRRTTRDRLFERILEEMEGTEGAVSLAPESFEIDRVSGLEVEVKR